jgi:hypothetical protein
MGDVIIRTGDRQFRVKDGETVEIDAGPAAARKRAERGIQDCLNEVERKVVNMKLTQRRIVGLRRQTRRLIAEMMPQKP